MKQDDTVFSADVLFVSERMWVHLNMDCVGENCSQHLDSNSQSFDLVHPNCLTFRDNVLIMHGPRAVGLSVKGL